MVVGAEQALSLAVGSGTENLPHRHLISRSCSVLFHYQTTLRNTRQSLLQDDEEAVTEVTGDAVDDNELAELQKDKENITKEV